LGSGSSHLFRSKGEDFEILKNDEVLQRGRGKDPLRALEEFMGTYRPVLYNDLPRFSGGAVGYLSYDVVRSFERIPEQLKQDIDLYDSSFMITDTLLVFDNLRKKIKIIINVFLDDRQSPRQSIETAYQEAQGKIKSIIARLQRHDSPSPIRKSFPLSPLHSNFEKQDYMKVVERAKEYIRAGDIIQVVPSQRFSTEIHAEPFDVYRALRSINPSPYLSRSDGSSGRQAD
jgi:anthranilate synthase component 1